MPAADTTDVLNRLLVIHHRSLPMYLSYAMPYRMQGDEQAVEVLSHIVDYQKEMVDRLGGLRAAKQIFQRLSDQIEQALGASEKGSAEDRQMRSAVTAFEERHADFLFEARDRLRDRGLRQVDQGRGPADAFEPGDRLEHSELPQTGLFSRELHVSMRGDRALSG